MIETNSPACRESRTRFVAIRSTSVSLSSWYCTKANSQSDSKMLRIKPTYQLLLTRARSVADTVTAGRVVVTLPDGTVVVDTAAADDPTNTLPSGNSFQHFSEKTVNENHNSRVAIFATQIYPCGIGVERKLSTINRCHGVVPRPSTRQTLGQRGYRPVVHRSDELGR